MNVQSGREYLNTVLSPQLPAGWKIIPYDDSVTADVPTVLYRVQRIVKHPAAPGSTYLATWVLTVISPAVDPSREDELDDLCMDLLDALRAARIPWTTAERVLWNAGGKLPAYDVEIQLPTTRSPKPTTTTTTTTEGDPE